MLHWTVARPLSDKECELSAELTITTQQQENLAATCDGLAKRARKAMAARRQAAESGDTPTAATPGSRRSAVAPQLVSGGGGRSGDAAPTQAQLNSVGGLGGFDVN